MPNTAASQHVTVDGVAADEQWLHVVAGVIFNATADAILLARRPSNKHQGDKWEFPGGKVEAGEGVERALARELEEELGILIEVSAIAPFIEVRHRYPDKNILLDVWRVNDFSGEPHGREGQVVRWFSLAALADLEFPAANEPILTALLSAGN